MDTAAWGERMTSQCEGDKQEATTEEQEQWQEEQKEQEQEKQEQEQEKQENQEEPEKAAEPDMGPGKQRQPLVGQDNLHYVVTEADRIPDICIEFDELEDTEIDKIDQERPATGSSPGFLSPDTVSMRSRGSRLSSASFLSFSSSFKMPRASDWRLPEKTDLFNRSFGLLLAFISGVLMTAYSSMLKLLVEMDSMQVVVIRGVLQLLVMGTIARHKGIPLLSIKKRKVSILLFFVAFTGGLRLLFIFTSMSRLPLGDSTTILFSSPIIVMVLSIFILKETCGVYRVVAGLSLITGVVLIAKPPILFGSDIQHYDAIGYGLVLSACFMSALGIVLTKLISKEVEKLVILFWLGVASSICGSLGLIMFGQPSLPGYQEWLLALAIGLLGLIQQYVLIWAVQLESPARVTIVRQMQIVLAYTIQVVLFGVMPTWTDLLGAALVLATVISITFEKSIVDFCNIYIFYCCRKVSPKSEETK